MQENQTKNHQLLFVSYEHYENESMNECETHKKKRESSRKATTTYATTQDNKHHRCNTRMNH